MTRKFPSLFLLFFVILGIILADLFRPPATMLLTGLTLIAVTGLLLVGRAEKPRVALLFGGALFFFSALHYAIQYYPNGEQHISSFVSTAQKYHIFGKVDDWPALKAEHTEVKIALDSLVDQRRYIVHGKILLKITDTTTMLQRGDRVELFGRIYPIKGGSFDSEFSYARYLNLKEVFGIVYLPTLLDVRLVPRSCLGWWRLVDDLRAKIKDVFQLNLTSASAALASGFLIGETRHIPSDVYRNFRDSGTMHLLAVSGSNVALVILAALFVLRPLRLSRNKRSAALLVVIFLFCFLSYGEPSVVRAALMASLIILSRILSRRTDLNNIIALTALIILLFSPAQLFDVGFQLSFVVAWSLIYFTPVVLKLFDKHHNRFWYRWLLFPLVVALIAQVFSAGLTAFYFNRISLISPLANIIIVPLVSAAVVGVLFMLAAHLVLPILGALAGSLLSYLLQLILFLVHQLGGAEGFAIETGRMSTLFVIFYHVVLFMLLYFLFVKRSRRAVLFTILTVANMILVHSVVASVQTSHLLCELSTVPGGIMAVTHYSANDRAELFLTGMTDEHYQFDEKILVPQLKALGVERLDRIVLLSADYGTLDDLHRLAITFEASELLLYSGLSNSYSDALKEAGFDSAEYKITLFGNSLEKNTIEGIHPSGKDIVLRCGDQLLFFTNNPDEASVAQGDTIRHNVLITGQTWRVGSKSWGRVCQSGFDEIICSRFIQVEGESDRWEVESLPEIPANVFELSRIGRICLDLGCPNPVR